MGAEGPVVGQRALQSVPVVGYELWIVTISWPLTVNGTMTASNVTSVALPSPTNSPVSPGMDSFSAKKTMPGKEEYFTSGFCLYTIIYL